MPAARAHYIFVNAYRRVQDKERRATRQAGIHLVTARRIEIEKVSEADRWIARIHRGLAARAADEALMLSRFAQSYRKAADALLVRLRQEAEARQIAEEAHLEARLAWEDSQVMEVAA